MIIDGTYLCEKKRLEVARAYLSHELKKVDLAAIEEKAGTIANRTTEEHATVLRRLLAETGKGDQQPDTLLMNMPCSALWTLFHALSFGYYCKELHNCVGHPYFSWGLRQENLGRLLFETRVGFLKGAPSNGGPLAYDDALDYARSLDKAELEQSIVKYDSASREDRTADPMIGRILPDQRILVHDGNGRLARICARVALGLDELSQQKGVSIWVGTERARDPKMYDVYKECRRSSVFYINRAG